MNFLSNVYIESGSVAFLFFIILFFLFRKGVKDIKEDVKNKDDIDLRKDLLGKSFIMKDYKKPKKR